MLALARKCGFLAGKGLELGGEVFGVSRLRWLLEDLLDCGKEVVEGPYVRQWRS
jgi:hypothetical protein